MVEIVREILNRPGIIRKGIESSDENENPLLIMTLGNRLRNKATYHRITTAQKKEKRFGGIS